jgi:xanthine dehydrogenase accessory factor
VVTPDVIAAMHRLRSDEILGSVATVVSGEGVGAKAVIEIGVGIVAGSLPEEVADDVLADAEQLAGTEQSRTLDYGERRVFIETLAPSPLLLVFGAGHVAQPLTRMARELGFRTIVADARATWATPERFPDVDELIVGWPDTVLDHVPLDHRTYVALLSHDARFEDPVFPAIRVAPVRYVGAMGSRRTHRERRERLAAAGWSEAELERIHGPIGLDIGAETPAETAVSILAEIIRVRYGHGSGTSLRGQDGRIHAQRGAELSPEP